MQNDQPPLSPTRSTDSEHPKRKEEESPNQEVGKAGSGAPTINNYQPSKETNQLSEPKSSIQTEVDSL
jgi:hypothetical protein